MAGISWKEIETLFEEALTRPPGAREAFLEAQPVSEALRQEVRSLLTAYEKGGDFFEDLAPAEAAETPAPGPPSDPLELEGRRAGRYVIEQYLGGGGMGIVYKARDTELGRPVALKFLPPHLTRHEEAVQRFVREARAAAGLDHPNIATVYEIGETEKGYRFIAMAYYAGETLKEKMAREGQLPIEEALAYAMQIAEGLAAAHGAGIVHRDIKPANVIVTDAGGVKIVDFGLAQVAAETELTDSGQTLGTAAYMSPEQARGEEAGPATDLWSLGVVLYEMLTGERPFRRVRESAVVHAILHEEPPALREKRPKVSETLAALTRQLLRKDAVDRPESARAFADQVRAIGEGSPPKAAGGGLREHLSVSAVGAAVVAVLLLGTWWLLGGPLGGKISGSAAQNSPAGEAREVEKRTMAVLPFETLGGTDTTNTITAGLHQDLLTRLANVSDLQVTSRTSVAEIREVSLTLPAIADTLGVRWILDGSVQQSGGQIDVRAQLIDPRRDVHIWANSYERSLTAANLFDLQGEIARAIAEALQAELSLEERHRLAGDPTENLEAYRHYVRGRRLFVQANLPDHSRLRAAARQFQKALAQDSTFALAWAGLADALGNGLYESSRFDSGGVPDLTQEMAARRAVELAPNLGEARAALGHAYFEKRNAPAALQELRRAVELKPSYAQAHQLLGTVLQIIGRFEEAFKHVQIAEELNPQHLIARHKLFDAYNWQGQHEKALAEARQQQRMFPNEEEAVWAEIRSLSLLGRHEQAVGLAQRRLADPVGDPERIVVRSHLVIIEARAGDTAQAETHLQALEQMELPSALRDRSFAHWQFGAAYAAVGNFEEAFGEYEQIDQWPVVLSAGFRRNSVLAPDPRYDQLLREMNQFWGLNPDGSIPAHRRVTRKSYRR